jgi:hypothetical protein
MMVLDIHLPVGELGNVPVQLLAAIPTAAARDILCAAADSLKLYAVELDLRAMRELADVVCEDLPDSLLSRLSNEQSVSAARNWHNCCDSH